MRKALSGLLLAVCAASASAQTVDEVIAKNLEARGGVDKIKAVKSMRMTGKMTVGPGIEVPVTLEIKKPGSVRLEMVFQGNTGIQAYDGKTGWGVSPMSASKAAEPMSAEDTRDMEEQADLDGSLVDWKAKGHTVELMGKEKVEGSDAFKIKLTLKNGEVRYVYIDADSHLELKTDAKRTVRGSEMEIESFLSDYKEVGGLIVPHTITQGQKGRPEKQVISIGKVELDVPIEDARFQMPVAEAKQP
jgi:outer membrane lipoprotein-sorting protein